MCLYFIVKNFHPFFKDIHISFVLFLDIGGISISGTAFNCWGQTENSLEKAKKLGALMGCPTGNTREMVRCLRYRPSKTVVQALGNYMVGIFYYRFISLLIVY